MEHPTLKELRSNVSNESRALVDILWNEYLTSGQWPSSRVLHSSHGKSYVREFLRPLTGNAVFEQEDYRGGSRYELTRLGVLLVSDGERLQKLLANYVSYLFQLFKKNPLKETITCLEAQTALSLTGEDAVLLGKLIGVMQLFGSFSYGVKGDDWQSSVLREVEDLTENSDFYEFVEKTAFKLYGIHKNVFIDERAFSGSVSYLKTTILPSTTQNDGAIAPLEKRYQVFVSSTYEDLKEERKHVMHALLETYCIPTGMELFPAADEEQMQLIKRMIDYCDYYILIVAGRYGTIDESSGKSFTEMEFDYAVSSGKPVLAFCRSNLESIPNSKCDDSDEKRQKLIRFVKKVKSSRICKHWDSPEGLSSAVKTSVLNAIIQSPQPGWVRSK